MVHRCCISSCGMNVRVAEAKGLSYHGFPTKEPMREQWIQAVIPHMDKPENFKVVPRYTRVCSRHFRKKDYCVDIKKRARLNSNAVPSVFPRKNSPLVVPNVLSTSPKVAKTKGSLNSANLPAITSTATSQSLPLPSVSTPVLVASCPSDDSIVSTATSPHLTTTVTWRLGPHSEDGTTTLDTSGLPREFLIESATLTDDQLTLTVIDPESLSTSSLSQEDVSQSCNLNLNEDSNDGPQKKRKRRKWNRTAFDRPPKGKKKDSSDESNIDGVGEALAEISLSTLMAISSPEIQDKLNDADSAASAKHSSPSNKVPVSEGSNVLQKISLSVDNSSVQSVPLDQVQHLSSIEQELLQSIQAVSLHCGEPENSESQGIQNSNNTDHQDVLSFINPIPPFLHHHSSEESLFSNDDDVLSSSIVDGTTNLDLQSSTASSTSPSEADLMAQIVGIGLHDRVPTVLEIDNLANHLNSSLLTTGPITLSIGHGDVHLSTTEATEQEQPCTPCTPEEEVKTSAEVDVPETIHLSEYQLSGKSSNSIKKKKPPEDFRLTGVTKKHKKEKFSGRFSVERFSNSDKDIEYYTGFSSYRNFEAFFRSLEAYVERLRVTDVMFGVTNLDKLHSDTSDGSVKGHAKTSNGSDEFVSPLPPPPALDEPQKRRPFHGRSMSRIDELFMTVIRLKRKLPEKVLGHMFCISQPTVSRIIRAWTVLLSKLIDCYPVENASDKGKSPKLGGRATAEHSYTSRGLGIPESFRQLFHCELAKSIVVTSVSAKDRKVNLGKTQGSVSKRSKKNRQESIDLFSESTTSTNPPSVTSFRCDTDDCTNSNTDSNLIFNFSGDLEVEETELFNSVDFI